VKQIFAVFCCLLPAAAAGAEECRSLTLVEWVLGEWTATPGKVVIHEQWHRVSDDTFEGESVTRSLTDDELVNYESLRLVAMSDGVFYIAKVTDNDLPVPFRLTQCSEALAVFENPLHDAPQRLIYRLLKGSDSGAPELEVRLEGDGMNDFSLWFHRP
jgi:hypothetical protein